MQHDQIIQQYGPDLPGSIIGGMPIEIGRIRITNTREGVHLVGMTGTILANTLRDVIEAMPPEDLTDFRRMWKIYGDQQIGDIIFSVTADPDGQPRYELTGTFEGEFMKENRPIFSSNLQARRPLTEAEIREWLMQSDDPTTGACHG